MKILCVASGGGHMYELKELMQFVSGHQICYVTNDKHFIERNGAESVKYTVKHSERDFYFFYNILEAIYILLKEKPNAIVSTGAGVIVPFALASFLTPINIDIVYIETKASSERLSLTGRIMKHISSYVLYRNRSLSIYLKNGILME